LATRSRAEISRRGLIELLALGAASPWLGRANALLARPSAVRVTRSEPSVTYTEFDPDRPFASMPPLGPEDAALCLTRHEIEAEFGYSFGFASRKRMPIVATSIDAVTRLQIDIYTPFDDPRALAHEEAHREIAEHYYENAAEIARSIGEELIGRRFEGAGDTRDAALQNAYDTMLAAYSAAYLARTDALGSAANDRFDEITDHGRNAIEEREAIELAIASFPAEIEATPSAEPPRRRRRA
jgi:hypothetical protein